MGQRRAASVVQCRLVPEANILRLDWSKADSLLGWRPLLSLPETIRMTVRGLSGLPAVALERSGHDDATDQRLHDARPGMSVPRQVVLAGATGFIGRALAERLARDGAQVQLPSSRETQIGHDALDRLAGIQGNAH